MSAIRNSEPARRFVVLQHDSQGIHYDLMFELGGVLKTWQVQEPIVDDCELPGCQSFDHRLKYLNFEGPIGDGRGHVKRWDYGTYSGSLEREPPFRLNLAGERLNGEMTLGMLEDEEWQISFFAAARLANL